MQLLIQLARGLPTFEHSGARLNLAEILVLRSSPAAADTDRLEKIAPCCRVLVSAEELVHPAGDDGMVKS